MRAPVQASSWAVVLRGKSGAGATRGDISSGQWAGSRFTHQSGTSSRLLGSKRAQPLCRDQQYEPIMDACSPAPLLPSQWISQSSPDRPGPLVNPTSEYPPRFCLGDFTLQIPSQMSQIVSDDQHCLCNAGQWERVSQFPASGRICGRAKRSRLLL